MKYSGDLPINLVYIITENLEICMGRNLVFVPICMGKYKRKAIPAIGTRKRRKYIANRTYRNSIQVMITIYLLDAKKYKPEVFHTARACNGSKENQRLVFPGTARTHS